MTSFATMPKKADMFKFRIIGWAKTSTIHAQAINVQMSLDTSIAPFEMFVEQGVVEVHLWFTTQQSRDEFARRAKDDAHFQRLTAV